MIVFANAKINFGLHIINKRTDGYHNLESIFYPIPLYDIIEFNELKDQDNEYQFTNSGLKVDSKPIENLCIKAYLMLKENYNLPALNIHLHKTIPFGAGLGGGSSDAACLINALNNNYNLQISVNERKNFASKLGADCVFFIENQPAYVEGIGDKLSTINLSLSEYYIALIYPSFGINTKEAYENISISPKEESLKNIALNSKGYWKERIYNDFEESVFIKYPILSDIKHDLYKSGAKYVSMSGSGSSIYGIFENDPDLKNKFPENYFIFKSKLE